MSGHVWPRDEEPRNDSTWWRTAWLLGRHPKVAALLDRTGLVTDDPNSNDGVPDCDFSKLAEAFVELDAQRRKWAEVTYYSDPPEDDDAYERWLVAHGIPKVGPAAEAIGPMSGTEVARLRLLATLSQERVSWHVQDLSGWDKDGQAYLRDWLHLVEREYASWR